MDKRSRLMGLVALGLFVILMTYLQQRSVETVILRSEAYLNNASTGDVLYLKISGRSVEELANLILDKWNYGEWMPDGNSYQIKTTRQGDEEMSAPRKCIVELKGMAYEIYTDDEKWGAAACQSIQEVADSPR